MVDPDRLQSLVSGLAAAVPADIQEAQEIIRQRESIVNQALLEARRTKETAGNEATSLVGAAEDERQARIAEHEIVKAAEERSDKIVQQGHHEAQQIVQEAQRKAYRILEEAEAVALAGREGRRPLTRGRYCSTSKSAWPTSSVRSAGASTYSGCTRPPMARRPPLSLPQPDRSDNLPPWSWAPPGPCPGGAGSRSGAKSGQPSRSDTAAVIRLVPDSGPTTSPSTATSGRRISLGSSSIRATSSSSVNESRLRPILRNEGLFQEKKSDTGLLPNSRRSSSSEKRSSKKSLDRSSTSACESHALTWVHVLQRL